MEKITKEYWSQWFNPITVELSCSRIAFYFKSIVYHVNILHVNVIYLVIGHFFPRVQLLQSRLYFFCCRAYALSTYQFPFPKHFRFLLAFVLCSAITKRCRTTSSSSSRRMKYRDEHTSTMIQNYICRTIVLLYSSILMVCHMYWDVGSACLLFSSFAQLLLFCCLSFSFGLCALWNVRMCSFNDASTRCASRRRRRRRRSTRDARAQSTHKHNTASRNCTVCTMLSVYV